MLIVGLTADSTSMLDLRTIADWTIRPRLLSTGGVAQVAVLGGDIKEYQVQLDPERMRHYGVTLSEVMNITREMNLNANGGVLYEYGNEYIVRGVLSTDKVDQIAKAVVRSNGVSGAPILLEDIADVQVGAKLPKLGTASERGKHAVLLTVTKQPATSTLEPYRQTGSFPARPAEESTGGRKGFHRSSSVKAVSSKVPSETFRSRCWREVFSLSSCFSCSLPTYVPQSSRW